MSSKPLTQPRVAALPFQAQHRILVAVQRRLERCVFNFTRAWCPELCRSKDWNCAEKVELHTAFRALQQDYRARMAPNVTSPKEGFGRLRADVVGIRHAAVHREPQSHRQLLRKLNSAHEFATVWLGDGQCGLELQRCRARVDAQFDQWKRRSRCITANLNARMELLKDCKRTPSDGYRRLLLEAARRLSQKHYGDCIIQVNRIVDVTIPGGV